MLKITVDYPEAFNAPKTKRNRDFSAMSSSPVNSVRITLPWIWLEPEENRFALQDLNRILADADRNGLEAVLAFNIEPAPVWLISKLSGEPVCPDNPLVFKSYSAFICRVMFQCAQSGASLIWDVGTLSSGKCFCPHTMGLFRKWLESEYGKLSELNRKWHTAYTSWNGVCACAGKNMSHQEQMEFERFSSWRARRTVSEMFRIAKKHAKDRDVIMSAPCCGQSGASELVMEKNESGSLASGWIDTASLELPSGGTRNSFFAASSECVSMLGADSFHASEHFRRNCQEDSPQITAWPNRESALTPYDFFFKAMSLGAKGIRLSTWDPVEQPGRYDRCASSIFSEQDFESDSERFEKLWECASVYEQNEQFFENWTADEPHAAILFSRHSSNIHRLTSGADLHMRSVRGWSRALTSRSIPFCVTDANHIGELKNTRLLILPRVTSLDESAAEKILDFAANGGTLFCEAETGAWNEFGFRRDRRNRIFAEAAGIIEYQRKTASKDKFKFKFQNDMFALSPGAWITPLRPIRGVTENMIPFESDKSLMLNFLYGSGAVILCAGFPGEASEVADPDSLGKFAAELAKAAGISSRFNIQPKKDADEYHVVCGESMGRRAAFVFMPQKVNRAEILFEKGFWSRRVIRELVSGSNVELASAPHGQLRLRIKSNPMRVAIFSE